MSPATASENRCHCTLIGMASSRNTDNATHTGEDVEPQELSFLAGGNGKWSSHFARQCSNFATKLNVLFPCAPDIVLLGIYPKVLKAYAYIDLYIPVILCRYVTRTCPNPQNV